jgi:hypothetical protein
MISNLMFTKTNYDVINQRYTYDLPSGLAFHNTQVALNNLVLFNCFYNITEEYKNNIITINFLGKTYEHEFPDDYYTIEKMNKSLRGTLFFNKLYMLDHKGDCIYFIEIVVNSIKNKTVIICTTKPNESQAFEALLTIPDRASWRFPKIPICPSISFCNEFGSLIGFNAGSYPANNLVNSMIFPTKTQELDVVSSLIITCNLLSNNDAVIFDGPLYSFKLSESYGWMMNQYPVPIYHDVRNAVYDSIEITIYDQSFRKVRLCELDGYITISIKPEL